MAKVVREAIACKLVDASAKLTASVIGQVAAQGYKAIIRYVPLPGLSASGDIDASELAAILDEGLGLLLVQHPRNPGWNPAQHSGQTDALAALEIAKTAGYLQGAHIYLDLEGISGTAPDTKVFAEAWSATIVGAGYSAGCYVGFNVPLNAVQLYNLHNFHTYWSDAGPRQVATRGFAVKQGNTVLIDGTQFDPDSLQPDKLGDMPFWMIAE